MYDPQASMTYDQTQGAGDEQFISTFFCRALYDYQTNDSSSLSFRKGDIIEVLTRLESGWWDGLLNDERGWFPSNYVVPISDEEAESALSLSEYPDQQHSGTHDLDSQSRPGNPGHDRGDPVRPNTASGRRPSNGTQSSDFWMPQVTADGQV